jgi:hypothetical protein
LAVHVLVISVESDGGLGAARSHNNVPAAVAQAFERRGRMQTAKLIQVGGVNRSARVMWRAITPLSVVRYDDVLAPSTPLDLLIILGAP